MAVQITLIQMPVLLFATRIILPPEQRFTVPVASPSHYNLQQYVAIRIHMLPFPDRWCSTIFSSGQLCLVSWYTALRSWTDGPTTLAVRLDRG
jgi:hypothetical protein